MAETLDVLRCEHRIIERGLRALDGVCSSLERGERVPPEVLSRLLDFIRTFADRFHHAKEEAHLFPVLIQHGVPLVGGPIGCMLYEHETGRQLVARMSSAANGYQSGHPEGASHFAESARQYIQLLTQHIQKEDNVLFKITEQLLDEQALASLGAAFAKAEAELGANTREECEQIVLELEEAWAAELVRS